MRIHTRLNESDIRDAARAAGVTFARLNTHGSRKSTRAFDVLLEGSGVTGGQWGNSGTHGAGPYKAATWDEWGIFLAHVFANDPNASATYYHDADDFHWQTGDRFRELTPAGQHVRHRWEWVRSMTENVDEDCRCGAIRRRGHLTDYLAREGGNVFELAGSER